MQSKTTTANRLARRAYPNTHQRARMQCNLNNKCVRVYSLATRVRQEPGIFPLHLLGLALVVRPSCRRPHSASHSIDTAINHTRTKHTHSINTRSRTHHDQSDDADGLMLCGACCMRRRIIITHAVVWKREACVFVRVCHKLMFLLFRFVRS